MISLLCNWFDDWGRSIKAGIGSAGLITLIVLFSFVALWVLYTILSASISKTKFVIKWFQIVFLIILVLFIVWFSIIL